MAATDDPAVMQQLAERVVREADRLARIVDDLLDLSHDRGARGADARAAPGARCSLPRPSTSCRPRPTPPACRFASSPEPPDVEISCDHRQLRSALVNLLDNAIKYSGPGEPVEVGARLDGDRVALVVRDHGIGIPTPRPRAHLRTLLPRRPGAQPRHRRHRPRPCDRPPRRPGARRRRHRPIARRRRFDVHAHAADRERRRRGRPKS